MSTESGPELDSQNPVRNLFRTQIPYSSTEYGARVRSPVRSSILRPQYGIYFGLRFRTQSGIYSGLKSRTPVWNPEPAQTLVCVRSSAQGNPSPGFGNLSPEFCNLSPEFCNVRFRTPVRSTECEYGVRSGARFSEPSTEFISDSDSVLQYGVRNLSTESGPELDSQNPVRNSFRTQIPYSVRNLSRTHIPYSVLQFGKPSYAGILEPQSGVLEPQSGAWQPQSGFLQRQIPYSGTESGV